MLVFSPRSSQWIAAEQQQQQQQRRNDEDDVDGRRLRGGDGRAEHRLKDNPAAALCAPPLCSPGSGRCRIVFVEYNFYFCDAETSISHRWCCCCLCCYCSSVRLAADDDDDVDRVVFFWPRVDEEDIECPSVVILYCWCWCGCGRWWSNVSSSLGWNRMAGWIAGL